MRQWISSPKDGVTCGLCGRRTEEKQPVQAVTIGKLPPRYRCAGCAEGEVDQQAVDASLHERESREAARQFNETIAHKNGAPVLPGFTALGNPLGTREEDLRALLKNEAGIKGIRRERVPAPRQPLPFSKIAGTLPASTDHD